MGAVSTMLVLLLTYITVADGMRQLLPPPSSYPADVKSESESLAHPGRHLLGPFAPAPIFEAPVRPPKLSDAQIAALTPVLRKFNELHDKVIKGVCIARRGPASAGAYITALRDSENEQVDHEQLYQFIAAARHWGIKSAKNLVTEVNLAVVGIRDGAPNWTHCNHGGRKLLQGQAVAVSGRIKSYLCGCGAFHCVL